MIARVADHCFWFGRYLERAASTARVLFVTRHLALDAELPPDVVWRPVLRITGEEPSFVARFGEAAAADGEAVQRFLTWDDQNLDSLRQTVRAARENARAIREVVSLEVWETTNELYLWVSGADAERDYTENRFGFYKRLRESLQLCLGHLNETMLRAEPLHFILLGVQLERVGQTARLLDVHHHTLPSLALRHSVVETALWLSLLRACSGFEPFMKTARGSITGEAVARFLLFEPRFPRSVRFSLSAALALLSSVRSPEGSGVARLAALNDRLVGDATMETSDANVHALLTHVVNETAGVCEDVGRELLGASTPSV